MKKLRKFTAKSSTHTKKPADCKVFFFSLLNSVKAKYSSLYEQICWHFHSFYNSLLLQRLLNAMHKTQQTKVSCLVCNAKAICVPVSWDVSDSFSIRHFFLFECRFTREKKERLNRGRVQSVTSLQECKCKTEQPRNRNDEDMHTNHKQERTMQEYRVCDTIHCSVIFLGGVSLLSCWKGTLTNIKQRQCKKKTVEKSYINKQTR